MFPLTKVKSKQNARLEIIFNSTCVKKMLLPVFDRFHYPLNHGLDVVLGLLGLLLDKGVLVETGKVLAIRHIYAKISES